MKCILHGYKPYDFEDKTGRQVKGVSLFTSFEADRTTGRETAKCSVKNTPTNMDDYLGAEIDVDFDQFGKVLAIHYPDAVSATRATATSQSGK